MEETLYSLRDQLGGKLLQKVVIWTDPIGNYVEENLVNRINETISHTLPEESRMPREKRIVSEPDIIAHVVKIKLPSQLNEGERLSTEGNFSNNILPESSLEKESPNGDSRQKKNHGNYRNRFDRSLDNQLTTADTVETENWLYHNTIIVSPASYGFQLHTFLQKENLVLMDNGISPLHAYLAKAVLLTILAVQKVVTTTTQIKSKECVNIT